MGRAIVITLYSDRMLLLGGGSFFDAIPLEVDGMETSRELHLRSLAQGRGLDVRWPWCERLLVGLGGVGSWVVRRVVG